MVSTFTFLYIQSIISFCDKKKAQWYVERELGKVILENPFTVQLTFIPNVRASEEMTDEDDKFYITEKLN